MSVAPSDELLRAHHVFVETDDAFQRRARLLQALWREARGLPIGSKPSGEPLGSRISAACAKESFANFMTETARRIARAELGETRDGAGKLIDKSRLLANLLSSQPLCFNLFSELHDDLALAARVLGSLFPERIAQVTAVRFAYSPGRDARATADRAAFDVFIEHTTPSGSRGFMGVTVKYHEDLGDAPSPHKPRYDALADAMRCFSDRHRATLRNKPLQQLWRDHLHAGALLTNRDDGWDTGLFVFLHAGGNVRCVDAAARYVDCLRDSRTFAPLTLERFIGALHEHATGSWVAELEGRYLGPRKIDA